MKMHRTAALIALALHAAPSLAQEKVSKQELVAMRSTPEQVAQMVEVRGDRDQLEPTVWVSTQPFLKRKIGDDKFLRANIDKLTGDVFYQLYLSGSAPQSLRLDRMTYLVDGELQSAKVDRIYFDVSCQRYGCTHFEDYVVTIPRDHMEALSKGEGDLSWRARLFGQTTEGIDIMFLRNETAGLLLAVDRLRVAFPAAPASQSE